MHDCFSAYSFRVSYTVGYEYTQHAYSGTTSFPRSSFPPSPCIIVPPPTVHRVTFMLDGVTPFPFIILQILRCFFLKTPEKKIWAPYGSYRWPVTSSVKTKCTCSTQRSFGYSIGNRYITIPQISQ